jgi:hypothetical protein
VFTGDLGFAGAGALLRGAGFCFRGRRVMNNDAAEGRNTDRIV